MKKKIAVLFGGKSGEYPVSLQSASAVMRNLDRDKYSVVPIGITREGDWYRYSGPVESVENDRWLDDPAYLVPVTVSLDRARRGFLELHYGGFRLCPVDLAFPALHGRNGEDGTVQGMLELAGIPVAGCGVLSSALCMDKDRAHRMVREAGIDVPNAVTFTCSNRAAGEREALEALSFPLFVKPLRAGSSLGVARVTEESHLSEAVDRALCFDDTVTVEEAVPGFEVGCAIVGNDEPVTGRVDEIELREGFFDFDSKYDNGSAIIHTPARIGPETERRVTETAKRIYRILGCSGFARVDMFLTPEGRVVFNEVNTVPGLTSHSRFPAMMRAAGIDLPAALELILEQYL